jgi:tetratricopeptide (TPR) repeat protein
MYSLGETIAAEAVRLDPNLAAAHAMVGTLRFLVRSDWDGAEKAFRRALEIDPLCHEALLNLGMLLSNAGRHDEAIAAVRGGVESDPFSVGANWNLSFRYYWAGDFDAAIRQLEHTVELAPGNELAWFTLAYVLSLGDRQDRSVHALGKWGELSGIPQETVSRLASLAEAYRRTGAANPEAVSDEILDALPFYWRIRLAAFVGDESTALRLLDEAGQEFSSQIISLRIDPLFDPLRDHPRFQALLEELTEDVEP